MKANTIMALTAIVMLSSLIAAPVFAAVDRFEPVEDGLVVRHPEKAFVGKNFNIGIYVADALVETNSSDGSGGNYDSAELYINVSGPGVCTMWNDWFEAQNLTIGPSDDLIIAPYLSGYLPGPDGILGTADDIPVYEYSMEYDEAVSKLGDVIGWTGNVVARVDAPGDYLFTLTGPGGTTLGSFTITVS